MAQQQDTTTTGEVEAINERGLKVNGAWLNWSKFAEVARPEVGQTVVLTVRGDRWIQGLRMLGPGGQAALDELGDDGPPPDDDDPGTWGYAPKGGGAAPRPVRPAAPVAPAPVIKPTGRATLKAAALAASAHFHSARPENTEDHVYETAYRFLAWLEDEEGPR